MPIVEIKLTNALPDNKQAELMKSLSKITADVLGKPELYVMLTIEFCPIMMGGEPGNAAWIEIHSIGGLNKNVSNQLAKEITAAIGKTTQIPGNRIYIALNEIRAAGLALNGQTFG